MLKNAKKIDDFLSINRPRMGQGKRKQEVQSNITDNQSAKMTTGKGTIQGMACVTAADEKINAVVPDNQFRKRNPVFAESEHYKKHKAIRKKTRKDQSGRDEVLHSSTFTVSLESNLCICPAGKEMLFQGNDFEGARGIYSRFRGKLKDCRECSLQTKCMKKPIKDQGRQVSFLNEEQEKIICLDLMKQKIDSPEGR